MRPYRLHVPVLAALLLTAVPPARGQVPDDKNDRNFEVQLFEPALGSHAFLTVAGMQPEPVAGPLMLVVAVIGLVANIFGALFLAQHHETSLNIRGAFLHIIGDAVSSVAVIIGGIVIYYTGWYLIDPILSVLIAIGIMIGAYGLVSESVNILLESAPAHIACTPGIPPT